ncbi:MAG TPA: 16S rRNA (cytosine(1402)-N(4))-methyltransferase RsmH [Chthoniobacterales bacterium]|jgi:16S rRNA (cytosine1402-N4)-methyltransferase
MSDETPSPHKRRVRYSGKNPRRFEDKYKEHRGDAETLAKVLEAGKTPAGVHRPILVDEILEVLRPQPGERFVDATLGFGGHAGAILPRLQPGGVLLGLDLDPIEQPKTEARLRGLGFDAESLLVRQSNYAGMGKIVAELGWGGVDGVLADLGLSSMQIDDPQRGFSVKFDGPLDMRMNPNRGLSAAEFLERVDVVKLEAALRENGDEPHAERIAARLAGARLSTTLQLRRQIEEAVEDQRGVELEPTVRRVFQAIRIAVNEEFSALETFLRNLPFCLNPGARVAILTFHSGEDRRVKHAFKAGLADGTFSEVARTVIRASPEEQHANPRSSSAKLRWAIR